MLSTGKYITENSLLILVDGETPVKCSNSNNGYQGSILNSCLNNNMNTDYMPSYQFAS